MFNVDHGPTAKPLFLDPSTGEQTKPVKLTPAPAPSYGEFPSPPPSYTPTPPPTMAPGATQGTDIADSCVNVESPDTNYGNNSSIRAKPGVLKPDDCWPGRSFVTGPAASSQPLANYPCSR
jgi:hypothetical protein